MDAFDKIELEMMKKQIESTNDKIDSTKHYVSRLEKQFDIFRSEYREDIKSVFSKLDRSIDHASEIYATKSEVKQIKKDVDNQVTRNSWSTSEVFKWGIATTGMIISLLFATGVF